MRRTKRCRRKPAIWIDFKRRGREEERDKEVKEMERRGEEGGVGGIVRVSPDSSKAETRI